MDGEGMQIDLLLCDHAQVSGDKLFVSGAGVDRMIVSTGSGAPLSVSFAVAGVVTLSPADAGSDHVVRFRVLAADGQNPSLAGSDDRVGSVGGDLRLEAGDSPAQEDQLVSFAFSFQAVPLTELGRYSVVAEVDGVEARRLGFAVESA